MSPYDFCIRIVVEAGALLLNAREGGLTVATKGGNERDIVTNVDREVNDFLIAEIKKAFPTHRIYSEEGGGQDEGGDDEWTIDPIDGSSNFSRGIPHFAVCLGLLVSGVPTVGAVYNPVTRELFSFEKGKGAFLNGRPIHVSAVDTLAQAQVVFSPGSRKKELWDWAGRAYRLLLEHALKRGMYGSSALDLCFIAAGRADASVYGTLTTLDIAPAIGILIEAGGRAVNSAGEPVALRSEPQKVFMGNSARMAEEVRSLLES